MNLLRWLAVGLALIGMGLMIVSTFWHWIRGRGKRSSTIPFFYYLTWPGKSKQMLLLGILLFFSAIFIGSIAEQ